MKRKRWIDGPCLMALLYLPLVGLFLAVDVSHAQRPSFQQRPSYEQRVFAKLQAESVRKVVEERKAEATEDALCGALNSTIPFYEYDAREAFDSSPLSAIAEALARNATTYYMEKLLPTQACSSSMEREQRAQCWSSHWAVHVLNYMIRHSKTNTMQLPDKRFCELKFAYVGKPRVFVGTGTALSRLLWHNTWLCDMQVELLLMQLQAIVSTYS